MGNSFRLTSNSMFNRDEENTRIPPLRIVFLSVEGNKTERQYFQYIEKYRQKLGIKKGVHVHPLQRAKNDNMSAPEDVLELLEEYLEIRSSENLPQRLKDVIPEKYSYEFIENYVNNKLKKDEKIKDFEQLLDEIGIDLTYSYFLKEFKGDKDIFGIVIDRDYKSHSVSQMQCIVSQCKEKGYHCFVTTPLFEFWLLLHLVDVMKTYPNEEEYFLQNESVSDKHTFISKEVSKIAGHSKSISEKVFLDSYLPNVDFALKQVSDNFTMDLRELIGDDSSERSRLGKLGTNIPKLFELLRNI